MQRMGFLALIVAVTAVSAQAAGERKMEGSYLRGGKGQAQSLSAVFTPVEGKAGEWTVVFTARFKDKDGQYKGTATGDPAGSVQGSVSNSGGKRTWRFEAKTTDGKLTGQHWETTGGKEQKTGTLEMTEKKP
jgi:hypothetical protein